MFSAFIRPFQSPGVFTPYGVNYAMAWVPLACNSFCTFDSYAPRQCLSSQYYIAVDGFPVLFCALLWPLSLSYYCLYQAFMCLFSSSIQAQALTWRYFSSTFSTCLAKMSSLLQGYWFVLLRGALGSLHSLFRRALMYFVTLELYSFCVLCIAKRSITATYNTY